MKKKTIITLSVIAAVGVAAYFLIPRQSPLEKLPVTETAPLHATTLENTISATGAVESTDSTNVYSTLQTSIQKVYVKVGDRVGVGSVLCSMDTSDLKLDITQQQLTIDAAQNIAKQQVSVSQKAYDDAKKNVDNNWNTSLLQAQTAVETAQNSLRQAQDTYDNLDNNVDDDEKDYVTARNDWKDARDYTSQMAAKLIAAEKTTKDDAIKEAEDNLQKAKQVEDNYKASYESLKSTYKTTNNTYTQAETSLKNAKANYASAQKQLTAVQGAINQQLDTSMDSIRTAQLSEDNKASLVALQKLKKQLKDSTVYSPTSGTVTAVYAKKGNAGTGLLFVVEDTDHLQISTQISEYDLPSVKIGMPATIKTDATGDKIFNGSLSEIDPTAQKSADGTTVTGNNVKFNATVTVNKKAPELRIGMNTRLNLLVQKKKNVFAVSYDTMAKKDGKSVIYTVTKNKDGSGTVKAVPIKTGLQTDLSVEISGAGLKKGMPIITNPDKVTNGQIVNLGTTKKSGK